MEFYCCIKTFDSDISVSLPVGNWEVPSSICHGASNSKGIFNLTEDLMPVLLVDQVGKPFTTTGAYSAVAVIGTANEPKYPWKSIPQVYNILDSNISVPSGINNTYNLWVLNVTGNDDSVYLPARDFAVGLYFRSNNAGEVVVSSNILKINTAEVIAFDLRFREKTTQNHSSSVLAEVKCSELEQHGIQLLTMYI